VNKPSSRLRAITRNSQKKFCKEKEKGKRKIQRNVPGNPWKARERKESSKFICGN